MEFYGKSYYFHLNFDKFLIHLWNKFIAACNRFIDIIRKFPKRLGRLFTHFVQALEQMQKLTTGDERPEKGSFIKRLSKWWIEFVILFLDIFGLPEIYETIMDFVKFNSRSLHHWEIKLAKEIFGDSINYKRVRIDELSIAGPKQKNFCYVSFYIINSWGRMQNSTLIHELTHVWQFERMGSVYIPQALLAQNSKMGYNYGGISALKAYREQGKSFLSFNLEQQGDIISDYFRIKEGYQPRWGNGDRHDLSVYKHFVDQMRIE